MNDRARIQANTVTPVAALDGNGSVGAADDCIVAERNDDTWPVSAPEAREDGKVQVVVVIVADKDHVDRGQVIECDAGRGASGRTRKRQWAGALRPDRIEEDIQAGDLNKETRVTDKRDAALFFLQSCRGPVLGGLRQHVRPSGGT
jgi:hypothetical protein